MNPGRMKSRTLSSFAWTSHTNQFNQLSSLVRSLLRFRKLLPPSRSTRLTKPSFMPLPVLRILLRKSKSKNLTIHLWPHTLGNEGVGMGMEVIHGEISIGKILRGEMMYVFGAADVAISLRDALPICPSMPRIDFYLPTPRTMSSRILTKTRAFR